MEEIVLKNKVPAFFDYFKQDNPLFGDRAIKDEVRRRKIRKFANKQTDRQGTIKQTVQTLRPLQSSADRLGSGPTLISIKHSLFTIVFQLILIYVFR